MKTLHKSLTCLAILGTLVLAIQAENEGSYEAFADADGKSDDFFTNRIEARREQLRDLRNLLDPACLLWSRRSNHCFNSRKRSYSSRKVNIFLFNLFQKVVVEQCKTDNFRYPATIQSILHVKGFNNMLIRVIRKKKQRTKSNQHSTSCPKLFLTFYSFLCRQQNYHQLSLILTSKGTKLLPLKATGNMPLTRFNISIRQVFSQKLKLIFSTEITHFVKNFCILLWQLICAHID